MTTFFLFFCRRLFFSVLHVCSSKWLRDVTVLQSFAFYSSQLSFPFCDCMYPLPFSINVVSIGILLQCLLSRRHSAVCCPCSYRNSAFHTASKTCLNHLQSALSSTTCISVCCVLLVTFAFFNPDFHFSTFNFFIASCSVVFLVRSLGSATYMTACSVTGVSVTENGSWTVAGLLSVLSRGGSVHGSHIGHCTFLV